MPSHCCVYDCKKKGYRDDDGNKISFFKFPTEKVLKSKWKHAIKSHFKINDSTKVCSRHFRSNDVKKTLAGKNILVPDAVPSLFPWTRTSPRKRRPPKERNAAVNNGKEDEIICESIMEEELDFEVVVREDDPKVLAEIATQTDCSTIDLEAIVTEVAEKGERIRVLEQKIQELESEQRELEENNETLQSKVFCLDKFKSVNAAATFYTGFEDWDTFMAIYNYLDPGQKGENIRFWKSSSTNLSSGET